MFDLSLPKLLVLAVIALVVFGPNELPKMAAKAGKALRELRRIADGAKADLREGLGPEFAEFDINDLNPRHFVQKHLLSDLDGEMNGNSGSARPRRPPRLRPPPRRTAPLRHRSDVRRVSRGATPRTPARSAPRCGTSPTHRSLAGLKARPSPGNDRPAVARCGSSPTAPASSR